jgi:NADH:ubiquinone reductase (H+-translocating)
MKIMKTKILILGSGYTSVWAYKHLLKNLSKTDTEKLEIEVISASDHHAFHGFTGEFLGGFLPLKLRHTPNELLFAKATIKKGYVQHINQTNRQVKYYNLDSLKYETCTYDHLVLGIGTADDKTKVTGTGQYAFSVKENNGIEKIRQKITAILKESESKLEPEKTLNFAICGAGLAGTELCANLCEYLQNLEPYFTVLQKQKYKIHLLHAGSRILPQLLPQFEGLVHYSEKILQNYNVQIHANCQILEYTANGIVLVNGSFLECDLAISTIGQKICIPDTTEPLATASSGRILGNKYLNAKGYNNIWIGGDIAAIPHVSGKYDCRADALWALKHGTWIGRNIARSIKGQRLKPFTFYGLGQAASLGQNKAFTELYGIQIKGILAWWVRFGFFLYFMPKRSYACATFLSLFDKEKWLFEIQNNSHIYHNKQTQKAYIPDSKLDTLTNPA